MEKITTKFTKASLLLFAYLIILNLFVTCKKTIVINNYYTSTDSTKFGLLKTPDSVYYSYPAASIPTATLANSFSLDIPANSFNQGTYQGSCASAASAMAKSILDHTQFNTPYYNNGITYSTAFLYNQVKEGNDCISGSYVDRNLNKITTIGVCKESEMPYSPSNCTNLPSSIQFSQASNNKIQGFEILNMPLSKNSLKQLINAGNPIIVCFKVDDNFSNLTGTSTWSNFGNPLANVDGSPAQHAALLVGWNDTKNAFKLLNSWGNSWGNDGTGWISYDIVTNSNYFYQAYKVINSSINTSGLTVSGDLSFPNTQTGNTSTKAIQINNNTSSSINVSNISSSAPFSTSWSSSNIPANGSKQLTVTFAPTLVGVFSQTLTLTFGNSSISIPASGTGATSGNQYPIINVTGDLTFGNVTVGQSSTKTFTISNTGTSTMNISSITSSSSKFTISNPPSSISAGQSKSINVIFSPTNTSNYSCTITILSNATGSNTINANGTGVLNEPTVIPAIGTYSSCPSTNGAVVCSNNLSFGQGVVNAKIVSINKNSGQIVFELKKCNGTSFNAGGSMHIVYSLCAGGNTLGSKTFVSGSQTVQHTITETNMTGTKVYYVYTLQSGSQNSIYYHAQPITVTY